MKKIRRKNQMVITALALMIAVAGYLNFSGKEITLLNDPIKTEQADASDALEAQEVANEDEKTTAEEGEDNSESASLETDVDGAETVETAGEEVAAKNSDEEDMLSSAADDNPDVADASSKDVAAADSGDDSLISAATQDEVDDTVSAQSNQVANTLMAAQLNKEQSRSKNKEMLMDIINSKNVTKAQKKKATNQLLKLSDYMEKEAAVEQVLTAKGYKDCMVNVSEDSVDVMVALSEITDVDRAKIEDVVQRKTGVSINNIVISSFK